MLSIPIIIGICPFAVYYQNPTEIADFDKTIDDIEKGLSYSFVNSPAVKVDIINTTDYYKNISPELETVFIPYS